jgi:hypothetical protein
MKLDLVRIMLTVALCLTASSVRAENPGHSAHALLIAVSDYRGTAGLESLNGPTNDIELMRKLLIYRFHVSKANVKLLINGNAKHTSIETAFADLAKAVKPGDFVYIHYSGHGSTAADPQEQSGEDQTWVSYGARSSKTMGKDNMDVLDKEIALWLKPLYEKTDEVVFVSDSCHSATVAKGDRRGVRSAPGSLKPHPLLATLPRLPPPTNGLRVGAARDWESAVELDPKTGASCDSAKNCYGVFTWYWADALNNSRPDASWTEIFNRARALVATRITVSQRPQMEGAGDRRVFGGIPTERAPVVGVIRVNADGSFALDSGMLSGVTVGSIYERVDDDVQRNPGKASLKITDVRPLDSDASTVEGKFHAGDIVRESAHATSVPPIRLNVASDFASTVVRQIRESVQAAQSNKLAAFVLETDPAKADWWIRVVRSKVAPAGSPLTSTQLRLPESDACAALPCTPPSIWVVSRPGNLLHQTLRIEVDEPSKAIDTLIERLRKFARSQEIKRLAAVGSTVPARLRLSVIRRSGADPKEGCKTAAKDPTAQGWSTFGPYLLQQMTTTPVLDDCISFSLENTDHQKSWYAYVIVIGPDLAVQMIFPAPGADEDDARIVPDARIPVPAAYRLNAPGIETIMLIASARPVVSIRNLEQVGVKGETSYIGRLLAGAIRRKGDPERFDVQAWGAESVDFVIAKP